MEACQISLIQTKGGEPHGAAG